VGEVVKIETVLSQQPALSQSLDRITFIHRAFSSSFLPFCTTAFFTFCCSPCRSFKVLNFLVTFEDPVARVGKVRRLFLSTSNRGFTGSGMI
jgi:hypothetical protein